MSTFPATQDPVVGEDTDPDDTVPLTGTLVTVPPPAFANPALNGKVIVVISYKGGVGKTTFAYEIAYLVNGILVDFEHDKGAATVTWGYRYDLRLRAPLIEAFEKNRIPVPLKGIRKPDLVPGHPDLAFVSLPADLVADNLEAWAREWNRPVVVDTHPGGSEQTRGAAQAASVLVSPCPLAVKELEALDGMTDELADYPIMVIPNKVDRVPDAGMIGRLERIAAKPGITVGPSVSAYSWLPKRTQRVAVTSYNPPSKRIAPLDAELRTVTRAVTDYVAA